MILTKLDGDARGGAALSVKEVVGRPIAFASVGEKLEDFEPFHPGPPRQPHPRDGRRRDADRQGRIRFRGRRRPTETASRLLEGTFTFDDFLTTMQQVLGMGNLRSLLTA